MEEQVERCVKEGVVISFDGGFEDSRECSCMDINHKLDLGIWRDGNSNLKRQEGNATIERQTPVSNVIMF